LGSAVCAALPTGQALAGPAFGKRFGIGNMLDWYISKAFAETTNDRTALWKSIGPRNVLNSA
jgi:hypothetical protein